MAANDKILKALDSALKYLSNSISAFKKTDESSFSSCVWHVAAELEYALFLFSLAAKDENGMSKVKLNPESKNHQIYDALLKVKDLLNEAKNYVNCGNFLDAYRNAHLARLYMFEVQENLAKKKREASLKKK
ncbi:MAG: hypothetical protein QW717_05455 [Candidatus Bathyarchaeia archaeon]